MASELPRPVRWVEPSMSVKRKVTVPEGGVMVSLAISA